MSIFDSEIKRQVQEFINYKREKRGIYHASHHKEWLVKFLYVTKKKSIYDVTIDDIYEFKDMMMNRYSSEYLISESLHSVRCLLRYYRKYDILAHMAKPGRKPNLEKIQEVRHYRKKGLTFRDIQAVFKNREAGRETALKTLHFWAHYKL